MLQRDYYINGSALFWFKSYRYLDDRSFKVAIDSSHSMSQDMHYGVPESSIVGPVLFILYTKHVGNIAHFYGVMLNMCANDCQLYVDFDPDLIQEVKLAISKLQNCLHDIYVRMTNHYLKLNVNKYVLFLTGCDVCENL